MAIPTTRVRRRHTTESRRRRLGRSAACSGFVIPGGREERERGKEGGMEGGRKEERESSFMKTHTREDHTATHPH